MQHVAFGLDKPKLELLYQTAFSKEFRISFREGQIMSSHRSALPITVEVVRGRIVFGLCDQKYDLAAGDLLSVEAGVMHDLQASEESLVRLTIHKIADSTD